MRNYLTTLPAAVALTGALLWSAAAPAFADCRTWQVCISIGDLSICVTVTACEDEDGI